MAGSGCWAKRPRRGVPDASIKMPQRNGIIHPKMQPWVNGEARIIGVIELWQVAPPPALPPQRLDCALMDFTTMGFI